MRSVLVVGAGLAGLSTARALRVSGFDGSLTLVGAESRRPYDRPPLSKDFLLGVVDAAHLGLEPPGDDLDVTWILGRRATALDARTGEVALDDGRVLAADAVVIATGARALRLPADRGGSLGGVHVLRTLDDAVALRADLVPGARLVVVGGGFVGAEVASTARTLGLEVTVVEADPVPMAGAVGEVLGALLARLHAAHGVTLLTGVPVRHIVGDASVTGVRLADDTVLAADVVVVGVGAAPDVEWLEGSGLGIDGGVVCDAAGRSTSPGVFAVGDCAAWWDASLGTHRRIEHWTEARDRPAVVASAMLGGPGHHGGVTKPPYFWSEQYGCRIQFAGTRRGDERLTIEHGGDDPGDVVAVFWRDDVPVAVLGVGQPRLFARWRRALSL